MNQNSVRIIAGKWRNRKIHFPNNQTLRPTPSRVKETLFNWLGSQVQHAYCLDLFAGSGALGFEALSRGAEQVVFLEQDFKTAMALQKSADILETKSIEIVQENAIAWLKKPSRVFDIVFVDPPYQTDLLPITLELLESQGWLRLDSFIYFESNHGLPNTLLPKTWECLREKKASRVYYYLMRKSR